MYVGHVGAALAGKRARQSIGLAVLLIATYTPDWVDTGLCLAGTYNPDGVLSHSIPSVLLFALVGFAGYAIIARDWRGGLVVGAVILSHMFLDWITGYKPTWPGGTMIGLRVYTHPIADFIVEALVIFGGALLYAKTLPHRRRPWADLAIMAGALIALQLSIDVAHMLMQTLPKC
ncbi:MAG TPA: metal-dependent hydrolase [Gemmatimonadaceae bacterium]|nr:metal-dependent hydrolase [Gemmatimonadaceae bacterium]